MFSESACMNRKHHQRSSKLHLRSGIQARSIDSTADTREIFKKEVEELQKRLAVQKIVKLPGYRDHLAVICKASR